MVERVAERFPFGPIRVVGDRFGGISADRAVGDMAADNRVIP